MQTIEEAAREYVDDIGFGMSTQSEYYEGYKTCLETEGEEAFKAGVEFAQRWISVDDELPPCSDEYILIKGIDSDGRENMPDIGYMYSSNENKPSKENFISLSGEITEVTHWRYLELN